MKCPVLILRPEPGASATAERARSLGLEPVLAPLFTIRAIAAPLDGDYDAVLLTSANGARHAARFLELPCYAVGEATAKAARQAGYGDVRVGRSDGQAVAEQMRADGIRRAIHLCGLDHLPIEIPEVRIDRHVVYAADPVAALPEPALRALDRHAIVLLHSPRAGRLLAELVEDRSGTALVAISPAVAAAAGEGWASKSIARAPRDEALLELAAKLCQTKPASQGGEAEQGTEDGI